MNSEMTQSIDPKYLEIMSKAMEQKVENEEEKKEENSMKGTEKPNDSEISSKNDPESKLNLKESTSNVIKEEIIEVKQKEPKKIIPVTFSYLSNKLKKTYPKKYNLKSEEFYDRIIEIGSAEEINSFWAIFQHIKSPSECEQGISIYLFKTGILPLWEVDENINGGKLSILLNNDMGDYFWEEAVFAFTGGVLPYMQEINGLVIKPKRDYMELAFWVRKSDYNFLFKLSTSFAKFFQIPSADFFSFQNFKDILSS